MTVAVFYGKASIQWIFKFKRDKKTQRIFYILQTFNWGPSKINQVFNEKVQIFEVEKESSGYNNSCSPNLILDFEDD